MVGTKSGAAKSGPNKFLQKFGLDDCLETEFQDVENIWSKFLKTFLQV